MGDCRSAKARRGPPSDSLPRFCYGAFVNREEALALLKANEPELRRQGVAHAGLFGSLARGEARQTSDIDVLIRFDPTTSVTLWDYAGLKRRIAKMLSNSKRKIDVIDFDGMSPHVRPAVERDAVYAF
jgi:predicted nucleotidyltransferase